MNKFCQLCFNLLRWYWTEKTFEKGKNSYLFGMVTCFNFLIKCREFLTLHGEVQFIIDGKFSDKSLHNIYVGSFTYETTGLIGISSLCNFGIPYKTGGVGFITRIIFELCLLKILIYPFQIFFTDFPQLKRWNEK